MQKQYSNTYNTFTKLLKIYKSNMIDHENDIIESDGFKLTHISLTNISTCAESKSKDTIRFWGTIHLQLDIKDLESNNIEKNLFKYYLKTTSDSIELIHDQMEEPFTSIWGIDTKFEEQLIQSLLVDMIELNPYCLNGLTTAVFKTLINYVDFSLMDVETMEYYYKLYQVPELLPQVVLDLFYI